MWGYRGKELAKCEWNDEHKIVAPGYVWDSACSGQASQGRDWVKGDGEKLNQRHRGRVGKGLQNQLADDIVRCTSHVPEEAEDGHFDAQISIGHVRA